MTNMVKVWAWWSVLITMNVYALDDKCDMLLHTREQVASTHVSFQPYISWTQHVFYKLMRGPPPSPALQLLAHPHQATILSHACDVALAAILVILDPYTFGGLLWLMTYSECIVRIYLLKFSGDRVNMSQLEWFNYIICTITHWKKKGNLSKAKRHNKSKKHFGYPKRYPKSHIRNTDFRYLKHFAFLTYKHIVWQVFISKR